MIRLLTVFVSIFILLLNCAAQKIQYSDQNIFIGNPDQSFMVGLRNCQHLLAFTNNQKPQLFIFDKELQFVKDVTIPYKFPERSSVRITGFENYYYIYIRTYFNPRNMLWKVDADGNVTDMTAPFEKLVQPLFRGRTGFQLIAQKDLFLLFHRFSPGKDNMILLRLDSNLAPVYTHRIDFDMGAGDAQSQQLLLDNEMLVLRTRSYGRYLVLAKVNLRNGNVVNYTYESSFTYMQPGFKISADSSITIYSVLKQPGMDEEAKRYVFITRLNHSLVEEVPFRIMRQQFVKSTDVNFLLVNGYSNWITLWSGRPSFTPYTSFIPDTISPALNNGRITNRSRNLPYRYISEDSKLPVRFTLTNDRFQLQGDSLIRNNKNSYTLQPEKNISFIANRKPYIMVGQRFFKKNNGLLLITEENSRLLFTDLIVNGTYDYNLSQGITVAGGVIIPYRHKREAGLVKIIM